MTPNKSATFADALAYLEVPMTHRARILPPWKDDVLIAASVGPAGEAVTLWGSESLKQRSFSADHPQFKSAAAFMPDTTSWRARVVTSAPNGDTEAVEIKGPFPRFPHLQPLLGRAFLIAGTRCRFREGVAERNAVVFDADRVQQQVATLGDGIRDVQATPSGRIIVGYFDEGVFGNYGWGRDEAPAPIGAAGIVEFDAGLSPVQSYPFASRAAWDDDALPAIHDCYALNVVDETLWACVYSDFPVLRVHDGHVRAWRNDLVSGSHGLLVHDDIVGWIGGYGQSDRLTVARFSGDGVELRCVYRIPKEGAIHLKNRTRGSRLHRFTEEGDWFVLDLAMLDL